MHSLSSVNMWPIFLGRMVTANAFKLIFRAKLVTRWTTLFIFQAHDPSCTHIPGPHMVPTICTHARKGIIYLKHKLNFLINRSLYHSYTNFNERELSIYIIEEDFIMFLIRQTVFQQPEWGRQFDVYLCGNQIII